MWYWWKGGNGGDIEKLILENADGQVFSLSTYSTNIIENTAKKGNGGAAGAALKSSMPFSSHYIKGSAGKDGDADGTIVNISLRIY